MDDVDPSQPKEEDMLASVFGAVAEEEGGDSLNEDVAKLRRAWCNEVCAPELLGYEEELVADMHEMVNNQQGIVDENRTMDADHAFSASLYQMELDRLRYSLTKYLRTRLRKVERDAFHVLVSQAEMLDSGRLSEGERSYASDLVDLLGGHYKAVCLGQMPVHFQKLTDEGMVQEPDLDAFVVCRPREDVGTVQVDDQDALRTASQGAAAGQNSVDLKEGDAWVLRYRPIRSLVLEGRVDLI